MTNEKFIEYRNAIEREYSAAVTKHPKFCDALVPPCFDFEEEEKRWKKWNDEHGTHYACDILREEMAEAMNAIDKGNKENAKQELAQVCAVCLRIMDELDKEK